MGTRKECLLWSAEGLLECTKIVLAIKMPDGNVELIVNTNAIEKIKYIENAYDDDLHLKSNTDIKIVNYMFY